jgi:hypothetical protein
MSTRLRCAAAVVTVAIGFIGTEVSIAHAGAPSVDRFRTVEIDHTIPFIGCNGEPVITTFNGPVHAETVTFADGTLHFSLEANETATWTQDGVDYTMRNLFSLEQQIAPGTVVDVVANGIGTGSDGSRVHSHDVQHFTINAAGDLVVSFDRGWFTCA